MIQVVRALAQGLAVVWGHALAELRLLKDQMTGGGHRSVLSVLSSFLIPSAPAALNLLAEGQRPPTGGIV